MSVIRRAHSAHVHQAGLFALLLPLAVAWWWPLAIPFLIGFWIIRSVTAWIGALIGISVLYPMCLWLVLPGIVLALWIRRRFAPGAIGDSIPARVLTWCYLLSHLRWLGHGTGSARLGCEAAHLRSGGRALDGGPARNEWVQIAYEQGVMGLLLVGAFLWWLVGHLHADAISASLVVGLVLASGTSILRTRWGLPWWGCVAWLAAS